MTEPNLQACLRGDRLAQKQFYERFRGKMFVVCLRYANNREDAEDMLQEGFVRAFRDLSQYTGAGSLEGWVRKVIVNTALQFLQKQRRGLLTVGIDDQEFPDDSPEPMMQNESNPQQLLRILQQLPPGFRAIFNLHVLEGYSHPEIAEIMGISVGTSKSQLLRAKAHFRKLLEQNLVN